MLACSEGAAIHGIVMGLGMRACVSIGMQFVGNTRLGSV